MVRLDRAASEPLHQQLYRQIRDQIEAGAFVSKATRLPSSRALALDLNLSRMTVNQAFSQLIAEGYLRSVRGSGTFVAAPLPAALISARKLPVRKSIQSPQRVAERARKMLDVRTGKELDVGVAGPAGASLVPGLPAVDEFPMAVWERLRSKVLAQRGSHLLRYASSRGDLALRGALSTYLNDFRGARCLPEEIVIVSGMQQALLICTLALVNPGETIWMEDPGFHQARRVFAFAGGKVFPRPVDQEGIVITTAAKAPSPRLIYTTPSHQWPLGVTMSLQRRTDLLKYAHKTGAAILEDDYNSEFRFDGPPLPCLQGLDDAGSVIYAGTMSKILYPSLRIGYLVAAAPLIEHLVRLRSVMDQQSPSIDQATLALFITEGFFLRHLKRMRALYAERRAYFILQFERLLGAHFKLEVTPAGLHCVAWLQRKEDYPFFLQARDETGVMPARMSFFCIKAEPNPALVFGFASWTRAQIRESLMKFASAFERLRATSKIA